jgi:hypothetical protein
MAGTTTRPIASAAVTDKTYSFWVILACFIVLVIASLPIVLSFDLWVMGDKSSFLNLDFLLAKHYRLGVDACYSYGLLPVLIQHWLFLVFGRGYKPMLGCSVIVFGFTAYFWSLLRRMLPNRGLWLFAIAVLSPLILLVNPNLAYSIVILSMLYSLWLVLVGRLEAAMAVSSIGCFGVPSLPLLLTAMLGASMVLDSWLTGRRRPLQVVRRLVPGVLTYSVLFVILAAFFGFRSMAATFLPTNGIRFYRSTGWFGLDACLQFLHPSGYSTKYYLAYYVFSPVTWFVLSYLLLAYFGIHSVAVIVRTRRIEPAGLFLALSAALLFVFFFFAFGGRGQQEIYQPILVAGTLIAIARLPVRHRGRVLFAFLALGILGEVGQAYKTLVAWRTTRPEPNSFGLYVDPVFASELAQVVESSRTHNLLLFSYATGEHAYYPTIQSPEIWFLQPGLMFPSDRQRVLSQIDHADIVVEDLTRFHFFQDYDPDVRPRLSAMCMVSETANFRIFQRAPGESSLCRVNPIAR